MSKVVYFFFLGTLFVWGGPCTVDFPIQSGPPDPSIFAKTWDLVVFGAISRDFGTQLVSPAGAPPQVGAPT